MTPFLTFCLQFPDALHFEQDKQQFWCGDIDVDLCDTCPNRDIPGHSCNTFTPDELAYIQTNHPELLL